MHYRPILPGRQAEIDALADVRLSTWQHMTPVVELVPVAGRSVSYACRTLADRIADVWLPETRLAIDPGSVPADGRLLHGGGVLAELMVEVRDRLHGSLPVLRFGDAGAAADVRRGDPPELGMLLRLRRSDLRLPHRVLAAGLIAAVDGAGLRRRAVDLMVDLGPVGAAGVPPPVHATVLHVLRTPGWRSRTLVSGAFPPDLTGVPEPVTVEFPRRDERLWREVRDQLGGNLDFGTVHYRDPVAGRLGRGVSPRRRSWPRGPGAAAR